MTQSKDQQTKCALAALAYLAHYPGWHSFAADPQTIAAIKHLEVEGFAEVRESSAQVQFTGKLWADQPGTARKPYWTIVGVYETEMQPFCTYGPGDTWQDVLNAEFSTTGIPDDLAILSVLSGGHTDHLTGDKPLYILDIWEDSPPNAAPAPGGASPREYDSPDYQNAYCAEYAIALFTHHVQKGDFGMSLEVGLGTRRDEVVNIHTIMHALGEEDSSGRFHRGYLEERCDRWVEVERSNGPKYADAGYEIESFRSTEELRARFFDLGLRIDQAVVMKAKGEIENASN